MININRSLIEYRKNRGYLYVVSINSDESVWMEKQLGEEE